MTDQARTPTFQLPKRTARELATALAIRADALCGEPWEVPATAAMMREAAAALLAAEQREQALREALTEALNEWEYASQYKSEHLAKKHGDAERIAELRAALAASSEPPATGEK